MENQGRQKDIKVFGWDLTAKAISGIDGGYVTAVLQQDPEKMGAEALNALNSITSGKTVPKTIPGSGDGGNQSERRFIPSTV